MLPLATVTDQRHARFGHVVSDDGWIHAVMSWSQVFALWQREDHLCSRGGVDWPIDYGTRDVGFHHAMYSIVRYGVGQYPRLDGKPSCIPRRI